MLHFDLYACFDQLPAISFKLYMVNLVHMYEMILNINFFLCVLKFLPTCIQSSILILVLLVVGHFYVAQTSGYQKHRLLST